MKNTCQEFHDDLVAFVDGELSSERRTEVQLHLAACAECQAERSELVRSFEALDQLKGMSPRAGWLQEVERSILATEPAGRVVRFPARMVGIVVALAASIALAAGLVWLTSQDDAADDGIADKRPSPTPRVFSSSSPM